MSRQIVSVAIDFRSVVGGWCRESQSEVAVAFESTSQSWLEVDSVHFPEHAREAFQVCQIQHEGLLLGGDLPLLARDFPPCGLAGLILVPGLRLVITGKRVGGELEPFSVSFSGRAHFRDPRKR